MPRGRLPRPQGGDDRSSTADQDARFSYNRPNSAPPEAETANLQPGIGLVLDGADRTLVSDNLFGGHDLTGTALVDFCLGEPEACMHPLDIDPSPDMNRIVGNRFEGNKTDVIYIPGNGQGNCFAHNRPKRCAAAALPLSDEGAPLRDVGTHTPPDADPITLHGTVMLAKINEGGDLSGDHLTDDQNTFHERRRRGRLVLGHHEPALPRRRRLPERRDVRGEYRLHYTISRR